MIEISLTHTQFQSAYHWASDRHRTYFDRAVSKGKKRVVTMPYAGWQTLVRLLQEQVFTAWGVTRKTHLATTKTPGSAAALSTISRALAKAQGHPALHREVVLGYSAETFIVWRRSEHDLTWVLAPTGNSSAWQLEPVFEEGPAAAVGPTQSRVTAVTWWKATPISDDGLAEHYGWESTDEHQATGT